MLYVNSQSKVLANRLKKYVIHLFVHLFRLEILKKRDRNWRTARRIYIKKNFLY